jgi:hypothetical protein
LSFSLDLFLGAEGWGRKEMDETELRNARYAIARAQRDIDHFEKCISLYRESHGYGKRVRLAYKRLDAHPSLVEYADRVRD